MFVGVVEGLMVHFAKRQWDLLKVTRGLGIAGGSVRYRGGTVRGDGGCILEGVGG